MSRSTPPLQQHLLTRSDLARMAVPAGEVLSWLASGALEQVGLLPNAAKADPVFTVATPELRADLAARLAAIGKTAVVLSPLRVRSFLMRAIAAPDGAAPVDAEADLAQVLEQAAEITGELEAMLELATEEAHFESLDLAAELGDEQPAFREDGGGSAPALDELDACFDFADLEAATDDVATPKPAEEVVAALPEELPEAVQTELAELEPEPNLSEPPVPDDAAVTLRSDDAMAAPAAPEVLPPAAAAAAALAPALVSGTPPPPRVEPALARAVLASEVRASELPPNERVESLLGLLKDAVLELAQRPEPPRVDMRPFVVAMQASLDRSAEQAAATASVLHTLDARVDSLGERLDQAAARPPVFVAAPIAPGPTAPAQVVPARTLPLAMAGLGVLAVAWSVLFWIELDSPRLAAGTLVGANVAGCLLLSSWWRRG